MQEYISHFSAAQKWNVPYLENIFGMKYKEKREASGITDITVSERGRRYKRNGYIVHSCCMELPRNAIVKHNGENISSPELTFLQLAGELDIQRLIFLGISMCSHKAGRGHEALTTKRKIEILLKKTSKHRGSSKAVRALKYIEDGAASVPEAVGFMIITLPHILGGYGLKGARFNHEVHLKKDSQKLLRQKRCFLDIYYPNQKLDIEYNSAEYHSDPASQGEDSKRAAVLASQGIDVISFTTIQLYSKENCEKFIQNIAKHLGKRIVIRTDKFEAAHDDLRKLLSAK